MTKAWTYLLECELHGYTDTCTVTRNAPLTDNPADIRQIEADLSARAGDDVTVVKFVLVDGARDGGAT